jgi:histone acetyltransferase (RNA polymerase elongator complex component)
MDLEDLKVHIDEFIHEIKKNDQKKYVEIAFFGGSFTGIDPSLQEIYLEIAHDYKKTGLIDGIRLSTRPDYIDVEILNRLARYEVDTVELGVQSMDSKVLLLSQRGYKANVVQRASEAIKAKGFKLGLQMMIGLPGDSRDKSMDTARDICEIKPDFVRIYPTLVVKETFLEKLYYDKIYKPLSIETAVDWVKDLSHIFNEKKIPIIRLGLQPSDTLVKHLVAGPYHPSFGQLVSSGIIYDRLTEVLNKEVEIKKLKISVNKRFRSELVGQKKSNIFKLLENYHLSDVLIEDNGQLGHSIEVEVNGRFVAAISLPTKHKV